MIVSINQNNSDKYLNLFKEAYELLGLSDNEEGRFTSLAEYYGHMADLFATAKYKYVLLPLDEDPFHIDLNTRTITVPQSFSKCASVQSDQLAETIVFVVDRYFDFMDLSMTDIHVQWTIPENKKDGVEQYEGATRVEMIDLESEPGKIKFAWPLNSSITEYAGSVNFSVRFSLSDQTNADKLYYSLNTTSATIIIKPALQKDLDRAKVESPNELFQKAIVNSIYTGEGVIPPVMPEFIEPGSKIMTLEGTSEVDGVKIVALNENDTVTLYAQAIVADAGTISYKWYHKAEDGNFYDCEKFPVSFNEDGSVKETTVFGTSEDAFLLCDPQPTERVKNERYYYEDSSATLGYSLYTGNDFPAIVDGIEVELYERYGSFTVPDDVVITGWYQAAANNTITAGNKNITTVNPRFSDMCLIPGPSTITFKENGDLSDGMILQDGVAKLVVDLVEDPYNPEVTYEWRKSQNSEAEVLDETSIVINEGPEFNVSEPAWYGVEITSSLNREEKVQFSNICRVTDFPLPPIVEVRDDYTGNITDDEPPVFTVSAKISNVNNLNEKLLSDGFDYVWQIRWADADNFVDIEDSWKGISGLHTNSLTVNSDFQFLKGVTSASLRCLVINNLNGEKAVFDHSAYVDASGEVVTMGAINPALGKFEPALPYVMDNKDNWIRFTLVGQ